MGGASLAPHYVARIYSWYLPGYIYIFARNTRHLPGRNNYFARKILLICQEEINHLPGKEKLLIN